MHLRARRNRGRDRARFPGTRLPRAVRGGRLGHPGQSRHQSQLDHHRPGRVCHEQDPVPGGSPALSEVGRPLRLVKVDLTRGNSQVEEIQPADTQAYVGGSALAARLLYPQLSASLDPLSPEAPLLFMTGPLTGTAGPAVGRYVICAKSPATGLWGESNAGGHFGVELRATGYDGLWVYGRAPEPSYLVLQEGRVDLRSAAHLWGKADTYETQAVLREAIGEPLARIACIGLAGEALLPYALVLCDHGRVAGRTGMGAVMGSKRLKAVVVRGHGEIPLADPQTFARHRRRANLALKSDTVSHALRALGS